MRQLKPVGLFYEPFFMRRGAALSMESRPENRSAPSDCPIRSGMLYLCHRRMLVEREVHYAFTFSWNGVN